MRSDAIVLTGSSLLPLACLVIVVCIGCSGPARVPAPKFNAEAAAAEAISIYDEDGDGELGKKELKKCASIGNAIGEIDTDSSGTISEQEMADRIKYIMDGRDGRIAIMCRVVRGSNPVGDAKVTFEPEPFMGDVIESASGTTSETGRAVVGIADELGGVQPGFYKVKISRMSGSGKEQVKKKYNEETVLGQEITSGSIQISQGITYSI